MRASYKALYGILALLLLVGSLIAGHALRSSTPSIPRGTIVLRAESTEFFFGNPKFGFNCQLDTRNAPFSTYSTSTYCQSVTPFQSATLGDTGPAKLCIGMGCIGNPGLGTPTFPSSTTVTLGNARCLLDTRQVRCFSGKHGFVLAVDKTLNRHW